ncbi:MAG: CoA transferase, partial [Rhodospirillaceae bacterium]|nr:CoA transferase [Rhodospirillaceae bacterium]
GNAHSNIVPYQLFETADGHFILAVGNDAQFQRFCDFAGVSDLADDDRFNTNAQRIINREALIALLVPVLKTKASRHWLDGLAELGVPVGPVNTIAQVFEDPQVVHRGMKINMPHDLAGSVDLIASPIGMSETPVSYRRPPPTLGQHTDEVLSELLDMDADELEKMRRKGLL